MIFHENSSKDRSCQSYLEHDAVRTAQETSLCRHGLSMRVERNTGIVSSMDTKEQ